MSKKRTIDAFFGVPSKKARTKDEDTSGHSDLDTTTTATVATVATSATATLSSSIPTLAHGDDAPRLKTHHAQYPFPIPELPPSIGREVASLPARPGRAINDQPDLDLLYFEPYIPGYLAKDLFRFLRSELPFYRVEYDIHRYGTKTHIRTPR